MTTSTTGADEPGRHPSAASPVEPTEVWEAPRPTGPDFAAPDQAPGGQLGGGWSLSAQGSPNGSGFGPPATGAGPTAPFNVLPPSLAGSSIPAEADTQRRRRPWITWVALALVLGLVAGGGYFATLLLQPTAEPSPSSPATPASSELPIVTVTPTPPQPSQTQLASGGDVGQTLRITDATGTQLGQLSVLSATWTNQGEAAPAADQLYLILEVEVVSTRKSLRIHPTLFEVSDGAQEYLPAFGPALSQSVPGRSLAKGESITGQLGYQLPPGPVSLRMLDSSLRELVRVEIPGP